MIYIDLQYKRSLGLSPNMILGQMDANGPIPNI